MKIESERLEIVALNGEQMDLWVNDINRLEKELNCSYQAEPMEGEFLTIVRKQIKLTQDNEKYYYWHSFWMMIRKNDRVVVGSADFKGGPNSDGEVEIGYGLGKQFEHNGYMTEMVNAMCTWALQQKDIKSVIAETYKDNLPSQRVLGRCGFSLYKDNDSFWWRRDRK